MSGRRVRVFGVVAASLGILLGLSCGREEDRSHFVAMVGDRGLDTEAVRALIPNSSGDVGKRTELRQYVENWIETELLASEARRRGLEDDPAILRELERVKDELLAQAALRLLLPDTFTVTDRELEEYYQAKQEAYRRAQDEVRLQQIVVSQKSLAQEIYRRAVGGEDFAELARRYSEGPWAKRGGDTGMVPLANLPASLRQRLRRAKTGDVLRPIRIEDGYLVAKVLGLFPAGSVRALDEVRSEIEVKLKRRKYRRAYRALIRELSTRTEVWVNENLLGESVP